MRLFKSQEEKEQIDAARWGYDDFVKTAATAEPEKVRDLAIKFKANPARNALSEKERRKRGAEAFRAFADNVLADDFFTIDEEMAFSEVADALDVTSPYSKRSSVMCSSEWQSRERTTAV
jgi:hypothetical protein